MIHISKSKIEEKEKYTYLTATIEMPKEATDAWKKFALQCPSYTYIKADYALPDNKIDIWYRVDKEYEKYLCDDRNDGFVLALIHYAMATGQDIVSELPISQKLLFQLNYILIPTFCNRYSGFKRIFVQADETKDIYVTEGKVGTGMSCGIDSLYTVYSVNQDYIDTEYHINCLTFLDTGASHYIPHVSSNTPLEEINKVANKIHEHKIEKAREVATELGVPLLEVRSNLSDLYQGTFGPGNLYRNMSCILNLQKYFGKYYYSSAGYPIDDFHCDLNLDPANAEQLITPLFSTNSLEVISGGISRPRFVKTVELAEDKISQKYLNVCNLDKNCGHCPKCYRTLITLEILGKLEEFSECFDIEAYRKNRNPAYFWLVLNRKKEHFAIDIYKAAKEKKLVTKSMELKGRILGPFIHLKHKWK